ncbi:MAG TPA: TrkA family potassium uptake protein [Chloroflexota bacterium]|jgi:trk system potassium uptake protein TrkA
MATRKIIILGCGRVGAELARLLDRDGHDVTIIDPDVEAFRRLAPGFKGTIMAGDGLDDEILRQAGVEVADAFIALMDGDNHNIMASQIAKHVHRVPTVISQIKDPLRGEAYDALGIESVSPTILGADRIRDVMGATEPRPAP